LLTRESLGPNAREKLITLPKLDPFASWLARSVES
jgi:hypothetical protein